MAPSQPTVISRIVDDGGNTLPIVFSSIALGVALLGTGLVAGRTVLARRRLGTTS